MKVVLIMRRRFARFAFAASLLIPLLGQVGFAQAFTEVVTPFPAMFAGSLAWGDYDNDGDLDLLLEGSTTNSLLTRVYRNDGDGAFVDINAGLIGLVGGSVAWGDYDNDGDLDVLLNGAADGGFPTTAIYRNEGNGVFSRVDVSLLGVVTSAAVWFDYDNDGDLDILVTGQDQFGGLHVGLYRNDGNGIFTSVPTQLPAASYGSIACADYDKDGDQDVLLAGLGVDGAFCSLYRNNGQGVFQDIQVGFPWSYDGVVAWGDYDNDGDLDIVQTGTSSPSHVSKIYRNDGNNVFTDIGAGLREAWESYAAWGDFDNDGDLDLLHLGRDQPFTSLRRNDGNGVFNIEMVSGLKQLFGRGAWGDFDHDGDLDFVIMGLEGSGNRHTLLYRNNAGTTNRPPNAPTGLTAFGSSNGVQLAWAAATDLDQPGGLTYNLAIGTASGGNDLVSPMANLSNGFRRIVAIGNASSGLSWSITNLPGGTYFWRVQAIDNSFAGSSFAPEQHFHINAAPTISAIPDQTWRPGESNPPITFVVSDLETPASNLVVTAVSSDTNFLPNANLLLSGSGGNRTLTIVPVPNQFGDSVVTVTVQDGDGLTTRASFRVSVAGFTDLGLELPGYAGRPSLAWGDIDNDGHLDFYVTGNDGSSAFATSGRLYRNLGGTNFVAMTNTLPTGQQGDMAFGDFDNDGDLDVVIRAGTSQGVQVWRNNGSGLFSFVFETEFMYEAAVAWGDYNNDGRLDLAAGGWNSTIMFTRLYENAVNGAFNNVFTLPGVERGDLNWGDYDNDGDLDLALVGRQALASYGCAVYRNDNGVLTNSGLPFPAGWTANDWGDFDNDGDLDLLFARYDDNLVNQFTAIYTNNGNGGLTDSGVRLPGLADGSLQFGDYDSDGWLDILMTGASPSLGTNLTRVYRNNGNGTFTDTLSDLPAISNGRAAWGDFDNDGDLDILLTGAADGLGLITRVYRNDINRPNPLPTVPISFAARVTTNTVSLNWLPSGDSNQTAGLTYNLRVGREPGTGDIFSPMAAAFTGRRHLPQRGNTDLNSGWQLKNLAAGTYYWSVQAIDHGFAGSAFAPDRLFVVTQPPTMSALANQSLHVNATPAPIPFTITDAETPADNLLLSVQSSNPNLLPPANVVFGGAGNNRTITLTPVPDQLGSATLTVTVTDAEGWATNRFITVNVFNSTPTISDLTNQNIFPNSATLPLPFTIGDVETPASNLLLTVSSSNTNLVPVANIVFGGTDSNRTVAVTLAANQVGSTTITITVADPHGGSASVSFVVKVEEFLETAAGLPAVDYGSVAWGDYDNDGRLDILIAGYASTVSLTRIYRNEGNGSFTDIVAGLPGVREGSVAWGDYNNDGRLDILLTGVSSSGALSRIYRNNGDGTFSDIQAGLPAVSLSTALWADFDNDGALDVLISGNSPTGNVASVYRNNGNGTFADIHAGLLGVALSVAACADYDKDGKLDILLAGHLSPNPVTRIYRNHGNGVFTDINAGLFGVSGGSAAWGDYDNDGWPDLLLNGSVPGGGMTLLYHNNGNGTFTALPANLPGIYSGFSSWGDYDNDGKLDILFCGATYSGFRAAVYRGNRDGAFGDINLGLGVIGAFGAAGGWGDFDRDGRLDILFSGIFATRLYQNLNPATNTPPAAAVGLSVALSNRSVTFKWSASSDTQSPSTSLGYNLRVGTSPGGEDVISPSASSSGLRRMVRLGAVGQTNSWTLEDPPVSGTYYWSVQAIDGSFAGSPFAGEQSFTAAFLPGAHTLPASGVSNSQANLNGLASAKGPDSTAWFEWGATTNLGNVVGLAPLASNAVKFPVSAALTNLAPEINHYFRLVVSNGLGVTYGASVAFFTGNPPTITPLAPINVTATQATLRAQLNPNRSPAFGWFEFGTTTNYGAVTAATYFGNSTNLYTLSQTAAGLTSFTTYHYRVVATNEYGLRLSPDATFTTTAEPLVTTLNATATNFTGATLAATVNPNGLPTTVYFEYGATTNYGSFTAFTNVGGVRSNLTITQPVGGLQPGTVYNFRVVAANASAASLGANRAVRTLLPFTNASLRLPPMLVNGAAAWGDYNNDGRLDLVLAGATNASASFAPICRIFRNDGTNFTELNVGIPGLRYGAVAWGDFNNDGRLDLLVSGATNSVPTTVGLNCRVYRNDGNNIFTDINAGLPGIFNSSVAWADFNNDGRLDILIAGATNSGTSFLPISRIYLNNRNGTFSNLIVALPGRANGSLACADFNNDGRMDILMTGITNSSSSFSISTTIFRNNGNNTFTSIAAGLPGVRDSSVAWGDFDEDGDPDILLAGNTNAFTTGSPIARVYRNNGNSTFTDINAGLAGVHRAAAAWGDYNHDGKLDILLAGVNVSDQLLLSTIYRNTGSGAFESFSNGIPGVMFSTAAWGDYNNDGRLDIFIAGQLLGSSGLCAVYRNIYPATNTLPAAPTAPQLIVAANTATFRWDAASDNETESNGLTYNLRFGTSPGGGQIMSPAANASGTRLLVGTGNVGQRKVWTLTNLPPAGTFYWGVQAIDNSFAGSAFTPEQVFVVPGAPTVTVSNVTGLGPATATLNGFIDANGYETMANFEWGLTTNYGNATPLENFTTNAAYAPISATLGGLTPVTPYHWRLVASNSAGTSASLDQMFIPPDRPFIISHSVTNLTATKATLTAAVSPRAAATLVFFQHGLTPAYGNTTTATPIGSGTNAVSVTNNLGGLAADTTYYYRAVASNAFGVEYGTDASFATVPPPYLTYFAPLTNSIFQLEFSGATNLTYEVHSSTNLINWIVLGNAALGTNGRFQFTDLGATNSPVRFYRIRSP